MPSDALGPVHDGAVHCAASKSHSLTRMASTRWRRHMVNHC